MHFASCHLPVYEHVIASMYLFIFLVVHCVNYTYTYVHVYTLHVSGTVHIMLYVTGSGKI